jgi:hypothetical protein
LIDEKLRVTQPVVDFERGRKRGQIVSQRVLGRPEIQREETRTRVKRCRQSIRENQKTREENIQ